MAVRKGLRYPPGWVLRCRSCGRVWVLEVSFDIGGMKQLYHYCPYCKRNTFHDILGRVGEVEAGKGEEET